jgi:hypothetical protein
MYNYILYDEMNRPMETFYGPLRLAQWRELSEGWGIERFQWGVSQGSVSLASVKEHAVEWQAALEQIKGTGFISDEEMDARECR